MQIYLKIYRAHTAIDYSTHLNTFLWKVAVVWGLGLQGRPKTMKQSTQKLDITYNPNFHFLKQSQMKSQANTFLQSIGVTFQIYSSDWTYYCNTIFLLSFEKSFWKSIRAHFIFHALFLDFLSTKVCLIRAKASYLQNSKQLPGVECAGRPYIPLVYLISYKKYLCFIVNRVMRPLLCGQVTCSYCPLMLST